MRNSLRRLIYDADAMAKAQLEAQRLTGIDALFAYFDALVIPEAFGCKINFSSSVPAVEPIPINSVADVEALHVPDVHTSCRFPLTYSLIEKLAKTPGREVPVSSRDGRPLHHLRQNLWRGEDDGSHHT